MKIEHAFTYQYETKHFGEMLEHTEIKEGHCFENVINFCDLYNSKGRNTGVSLVVGLRAWDFGGCTSGYHYLVKDIDTGEFSDPQYSRYTFVEIHSWSLEEYKKDLEGFYIEQGFEQSSEFFQWYCDNGFGKVFEKSLELIKALASCRVKLSNKEIKEDCARNLPAVQPKYGTQIIEFKNVY